MLPDRFDTLLQFWPEKFNKFLTKYTLDMKEQEENRCSRIYDEINIGYNSRHWIHPMSKNEVLYAYRNVIYKFYYRGLVIRPFFWLFIRPYFFLKAKIHKRSFGYAQLV